MAFDTKGCLNYFFSLLKWFSSLVQWSRSKADFFSFSITGDGNRSLCLDFEIVFFFFLHPRVTSHHNPISAANGKMESVLISFCKSRNDNFSLVLLMFSRVFHFRKVKTLTCECVLSIVSSNFTFPLTFKSFVDFYPCMTGKQAAHEKHNLSLNVSRNKTHRFPS